jgi:hypothetical protein
MKQMFSPSELKRAADLAEMVEEEPSPLISVVRYESDVLFKILHYDQEQYLEIHRAPKNTFGNSLEFWMACIGNLTWNADFGAKTGIGECKPLSEYDWNRGSIKDFSTLPDYEAPRGRFEAAMMIRSEWNTHVAVCETDQEYFAYFWETTM